jgi:hypothetical protein
MSEVRLLTLEGGRRGEPIAFSVMNDGSKTARVSCALEFRSEAKWREVWGSLDSAEPSKSTRIHEVLAGSRYDFSVNAQTGSTLARLIQELGRGFYRVRVDVWGDGKDLSESLVSAEFSIPPAASPEEK